MRSVGVASDTPQAPRREPSPKTNTPQIPSLHRSGKIRMPLILILIFLSSSPELTFGGTLPEAYLVRLKRNDPRFDHRYQLLRKELLLSSPSLGT